jgi:hypothetical protein
MERILPVCHYQASALCMGLPEKRHRICWHLQAFDPCSSAKLTDAAVHNQLMGNARLRFQTIGKSTESVEKK